MWGEEGTRELECLAEDLKLLFTQSSSLTRQSIQKERGNEEESGL